jgi:hypothetical protein
MSQILTILIYTLLALTSFLFTNSDFSIYTPQLIALISIIFIILLFQKKLSLHLISFIIALTVFFTGGLNSSFFFLIYFLLFTLAFQNPPSTTLSYSLVLILLLSQSLNSVQSLIPLSSLLLITPLSWFIGKQYLEKVKIESDLSVDETNFLMWLSLKFKTGICQIIETSSELLSTPLQPIQKEKIRYIKDSAKSLLNSSEKLKTEIDQQSDEDN